MCVCVYVCVKVVIHWNQPRGASFRWHCSDSTRPNADEHQRTWAVCQGPATKRLQSYMDKLCSGQLRQFLENTIMCHTLGMPSPSVVLHETAQPHAHSCMQHAARMLSFTEGSNIPHLILLNFVVLSLLHGTKTAGSGVGNGHASYDACA